MKVFSSRVFIYVLLMALPLNAGAQKASFSRALNKVVKGVEASARPQSVKNAAASVMKSEKALGGSRVRDMFEASFHPLPKDAPKNFMAANQRLQQEVLSNFLEKEAFLSLQKSLAKKPVQFLLYDGVIPYAKLIDPSSRVILVGETHEQQRVAEEMLKILLDYKKAFPNKNIYYASEFVDDLSTSAQPVRALKPQEIKTAVRKRPFYRPYTYWVMRSGIPVIGLEDTAISAQAVAENYTANSNSAAYRMWSSPAGVEARNNHWAGIIENILKTDPKAVVFVHAGMGHTNYNQPAALSLKLREYRPFVMEFNYALGASLNGLLEEYAPFPQSVNRYRMQLRAKDERAFHNLLAVRVMKDKRWALATGCDMHVFFHDWVRFR